MRGTCVAGLGFRRRLDIRSIGIPGHVRWHSLFLLVLIKLLLLSPAAFLCCALARKCHNHKPKGEYNRYQGNRVIIQCITCVVALSPRQSITFKISIFHSIDWALTRVNRHYSLRWVCAAMLSAANISVTMLSVTSCQCPVATLSLSPV